MQNLSTAKLIPLAVGGLIALAALALGGGWYVQQMWQHSTMMDEVNYGHKLPPIPPVKTK